LSSRIFSTFSIILLVLGHPEHLSSSTDTPPALKRECYSKPLSGLTKHFKGFSKEFTELHVKRDGDMMLNFAIHRSQRETQSQKSTCVKTVHVHSVVSCGKLMQTGLQKCDLGLPSHRLSPK
jgi:hypothetical protein